MGTRKKFFLPPAVCDLPTYLHNFLLPLFWGVGLLVVFRCGGFTAYSAGFPAFVLLSLLVAGTILLLEFLGNGRRNAILTAIPGIMITVFLVLPSWHFTGTSVYLLVFLPAMFFLWHKHWRVNNSSAVDSNDLEEQETLSATEWDEKVQMKLLRRKEPNDAEWLEAWVRADFQEGTRVASIHVPFCPPFADQPKWETCQFEGNEVEIQIAQLNSLGVRLDLKRPSRRENQESVGIYLAVR